MSRNLIHIPKEVIVGLEKNATPTKSVTNSRGMSPNEGIRSSRIKSLEKRSDNTKVHNNIALPGFTLKKPGAYWAGGKGDAWTIIDPRGFFTFVSAGNLAQIMSCTAISEGLITEKCVWGYQSGEMILLPVNSEPYKEARENTDVIDKRVSLRDVKPGDKIFTHDKLEGVYLGGWHMNMGPDRHAWRSMNFSNVKRRYVMRLQNKSTGALVGYFSASSIKVSEVLEKAETPLTDKQVLDEITNAFKTGGNFTDYAESAVKAVEGKGGFSTYHRDVPVGVTKKKPTVEIDMIEVTLDDAKKRNGFFIGESSDGETFFINASEERSRGGFPAGSELSTTTILAMEGTKIKMDSAYGYRRKTLTTSNLKTLLEVEIITK